jgi:membrane associated rhomboid family serine protease
MFILPIGDGRRRYGGFPFVTVTIIVINVLAFALEILLPPESTDLLIFSFGLVPVLIHSGQGLGAISALTAMFLHGGVMHLLGNMWFLWIFGRKVEDMTGPFRFFLFYLLCGLCGGVLRLIFEPTNPVPSIGASGAIAGVMGAFLFLHSDERVRTLILLGPVVLWPRVPAALLLVMWLFLQLAGAAMSQMGGAEIDYWAHVGGFVAGLIFLYLFTGKEALYHRHQERKRPPEWAFNERLALPVSKRQT